MDTKICEGEMRLSEIEKEEFKIIERALYNKIYPYFFNRTNEGFDYWWEVLEAVRRNIRQKLEPEKCEKCRKELE